MLNKDNSDKDTPIQHLTWLVDSRNRIQEILVQLYDFIEQKSNTTDLLTIKLFRQFAGLLVGAAFSLWRGIFLIDENEDEEKRKIQYHEMAFLRTTIRHNMIGYKQEAECNLWTSRYYINNAVFRLVSIGIILGLLKKAFWTQQPVTSPKLRIRKEFPDIAKSLDSLYKLWMTYLGWNESKAPPSKKVWTASIRLLDLYYRHGDNLVEHIRNIEQKRLRRIAKKKEVKKLTSQQTNAVMPMTTPINPVLRAHDQGNEHAQCTVRGKTSLKGIKQGS